MISHVFVVEQGENIRVSHYVRYFLFNGTGSVKNFDIDNFSEVAEYLKDCSEKYRDVRVYVIASENVHFAYELPLLENEEDIGAVVKLRLKRDLLFPVSQFLFALSWETVKKRTSVQVCGIKASVIGELRKACATASVDIHRVYMRDLLTMKSFAGLWKKRENASFVIRDNGLLFISNDSSKQQIFRFSPRSSTAVVNSAAQDSDSRLMGALVRTLNRVGCSQTLFVDDSLVTFFDSLEETEVKALSSIPAEDMPDYTLLRAKPSSISSKTPYSQIVSEEELGFHPTKAHGVAVLVSLWLLFSIYSLWSEDSLLTLKEESLMAASGKIDKAQRTRKKCEKQLAELNYVRKAFGLFDGEIYSTLGLIKNISQCRNGSVKIVSLKPSEARVQLVCFAANEKDVFSFVAALSKAPIIEKVTLKGINFKKNRKVNFVVELIRNG